VAEWTYPSELAEALLAFGLAPHTGTPPRLVRDQLNDLYRWEIRRLRDRLLAGEFPKGDYVGHVVALRKKYWPLSFTPDQWESVLVGGEGAPGDGASGGDTT